jgi:tetratricopeptide (TPR) repeat protein
LYPTEADYKLASMRPAWRAVGVVLLLALAPAPAVHANPRSVELRKAGFVHAYNLDHDQAVAAFRAAIEADPSDPGAYRAMAAIAWLNLLYRRGSVSVDDYLGSMTQPNIKLNSPPSELAAQFHTNVERALKLADEQLLARPGDAGAHYEVGAAVGQMAAYTATVDGKVVGGFTAARRAFDEHERVLELDPSRKDAGLIIGTYRYIVANLNVVMRWMAYVVGFGGGRERAMEALESCAGYPSDVQTEAKLALVLIYNRERRYDQALRILADLRERYPQNRLLWLEAGATELRAGRVSQALAALETGVAMFERDARPKAYGEGGLWYFKRGSARVAAGQAAPARADLERSLTLEARGWVRGRARIELGKLLDLEGKRAEAKAAYTAGSDLCRRDNDPLGVAEAERWLQRAYLGTNPPARRQ